MAVTIAVNASHSRFVGVNPKNIRVTLGTLDDPSLFFNFKLPPQTIDTVGDAGTNPRLFEISGRRPMYFESDYDFALLGSVASDPFQASRALSLVVDFVRKGILIVTQGSTVLTADEVANFTPIP